MILSGTGHRPKRLGLDYTRASEILLLNFVIMELRKLKNVELVYSGGALGFDTALADAAFELKIPYIIACPFAGQELRWSKEAQNNYHNMCSKAEKVVVVTPGGYAAWKLFFRNEYMVTKSTDILSLFDGINNGGTADAVRFARQQKKNIINCFISWRNFFDDQQGLRTNGK